MDGYIDRYCRPGIVSFYRYFCQNGVIHVFLFCDNLLTLCEVSFVNCVHFGPFLENKKGSIYRSLWNAKTLKLNISKLLRMQIETYNSKAEIWVQSSRHFQNCCNRRWNLFFSVSIIVATVLEVPFSVLKMGVSQYFCPCSVCTSHWCLEMSFWLKVCI